MWPIGDIVIARATKGDATEIAVDGRVVGDRSGNILPSSDNPERDVFEFSAELGDNFTCRRSDEDTVEEWSGKGIGE